MARLTRGQAAAKAREAAAALRRLNAVHGSTLTGTGHHYVAATQRQRYLGAKQELAELAALLEDLVAGLSEAGPMVDGKIGGQRQGGHDTSAAALQLVAPKAGTQRELVLIVVRGEQGNLTSRPAAGLTDVELAYRTGLPANSVRPRRVELVDGGWLEDSGQRRKHNGRDHVVWTLTEAARHTGDQPTTNPAGADAP